jgi:predicted CXXCH cytochrome family protein
MHSILRLSLLSLSLCAAAPAFLPAGPEAATGDGILSTKHNLSKSGRGTIKTVDEVQVCIFCHIPHHATEVKPLWSRPSVSTVYDIYSSTTRSAKPGQPTGSSRLCLSCHDGTIAVGALINNVTIPMAGGVTTLPLERATNLGGVMGKDLTNDHPISFAFTTDLVAKNGQLKLPSQINPKLKLDAGQNIQCTTCHNPHTNPYGKFLVIDNNASALCVSCHNITDWQGSVHSASGITAASGCENCHMPHNAKVAQRLMREYPEEMNCLPCHSSGGGARDILSLLSASSKHEVRDTVGVHDDAESSLLIQKHVECEDCHNPHALQSFIAAAPAVAGSLNRVKGVGLTGEVKAVSAYQYEICFKCHADKNFSSSVIIRQVSSLNKRLDFQLNNPSYHPVAGPGKGLNVPSLRSDLGYSTSSVIYCTDCHGSDQSVKAGGTGANGPHGSNFRYLLLQQYDTEFYPRPYSDANYALCFRCHSQQKLFDLTSPFSVPLAALSLHGKHVVEQGVPCFICHDPHGTSHANGATEQKNAHLVNFVTNFGIVASYDSTAVYKNCTSNCHSSNPRSYGPGAPAPKLPPRTKKPALRPF